MRAQQSLLENKSGREGAGACRRTRPAPFGRTRLV